MKDYFLGNGAFKPRFEDYVARFGKDARVVFESDLKTYYARNKVVLT